MRAEIPALAAFVLAAFAAGAAPATVTDYGECASLAVSDPEAAINEARAWREETGAIGARHCEAIALVELGAYRAAAEALGDVANAPELLAEERAAVLVQSAGLWTEAGEDARAAAALDAAVRVDPGPGALIERAAARVAAGDLARAASDLDGAVARAPNSAEALTLRAAVKRRSGDGTGARADALKAVEIEPKGGAGWFELGMAERALGLDDGARRSLLKAIDVEPGGPVATLARRALQDMDG
ncbi:MAG: hypothetical protein AAF322_19615 [Pseudomonadota bacterium]